MKALERGRREPGGRPACPDGANKVRNGAPGVRGSCWSVGRKRDVVLRLLRGESLEALSREVGVEIYRLEDCSGPGRWPMILERGVQASPGRPRGGDARRGEAALDGELSMENELLRESGTDTAEQRLALERCERSRAMIRHALRWPRGAPTVIQQRVSGVG